MGEIRPLVSSGRGEGLTIKWQKGIYREDGNVPHFSTLHYEVFKIYNKTEFFLWTTLPLYIHDQDYPTNISLFSICYKFLTHPFGHPLINYFGAFQIKLKTSAYLPLNTLACISLSRIKYPFITFFLFIYKKCININITTTKFWQIKLNVIQTPMKI